MLLIPAAFKMGIVTTMIFILVLLALKNLVIGKTILLINVGFILFKIIAFFSKFKSHGHHGHYGGWSHGGWSYGGASHGGWDPQKNIHVHIHNGHDKGITEYASAVPVHYPTSHQSYRHLS